MPSWPSFLDDLKCLDKLLGRQYNREQFLYKCVTDACDRAALTSWTVRLKGLRWEVITDFCLRVSRINIHFFFKI